MLHGLANLLAGMSLAQELHTIGFTIFIVIGSVCCFVGPEAARMVSTITWPRFSQCFKASVIPRD